MHELLTRQGFCLPQFNSKFVNRVTLTKIYNGQIFGLKSQHLVFRQCATPPTKLVMVQKLEKYLAAMNIKSGIDMSKANFPDKPWLILAVATLSKGMDEIFDPDYYPSKSLAKAVEQQMA